MKIAAISGDCNIIGIMLLKSDGAYTKPNLTIVLYYEKPEKPSGSSEILMKSMDCMKKLSKKSIKNSAHRFIQTEKNYGLGFLRLFYRYILIVLKLAF